MKISVDIGHPAQVHLFKHFIWEMEKRGHEILITASQKDISFQLLDAYGFDYVNMGSYGHSILRKVAQIPAMDLKMYWTVKDFRPDIFVGTASARGAHVANMLGKPSITLQDTEPGVSRDLWLYGGQTDVILTPACYKRDLGEKQVRYNGYHELAYLHPKYFTPNPAVLDMIDLDMDERYSVIRFVGWGSHVEIGGSGIKDGENLVKKLEEYGPVLITSERGLPEKLQPYQIRVPPEKLHDLLYYATLYVGEGATIASECAVLGTHAIYANSVGLGYIAEEDEGYHLVSDFSSRDCTNEAVLAEARRLLQNPDLRKEGKEKGKVLVQDKIDVTAFMVWFVENYPESVNQMKNHPETHQQFGDL